jgi:hypothetical protein
VAKVHHYAAQQSLYFLVPIVCMAAVVVFGNLSVHIDVVLLIAEGVLLTAQLSAARRNNRTLPHDRRLSLRRVIVRP